MKKSKLITSLAFFALAVCACMFGVYSIKYARTSASGKISFIPNGCTVEASAVIYNATNLTTPTLESTTLYVNKTNTLDGEPILIKTNQNSDFSLGEFYFVDNAINIKDIQIELTLKNKEVFPIKINFAFATDNNVGDVAQTSNNVYLSTNSYDMSTSLILDDISQVTSSKTINFYLHLNDIHSDLTAIDFKLNGSITEITQASTYTESTDITSVMQDYKGNTITDGGEISTVHSIVEQFIGGDAKDSSGNYINISDLTTSDTSRQDENKGVKLDFTENNINNIAYKYLLLSENENLANGKKYVIATTDKSITLYNLNVGTTYYYKYCLTLHDGTGLCKTGSFKTKKMPRILSIAGTRNFRDIGGWQTGVNIKQGILIRGREVDGLVESTYLISETEEKEFLSEFNFKYDLDLRAEKSDSQGKFLNINHKIYDYIYYENALTSAKTKAIFQDLAKSENYPMYVHCTYGIDRTGTLCALLEALLGVNIDDICRDYELSALWYADVKMSSGILKMMNALSSYTGTNNNLTSDATLQQRAEQVLLDLGVTFAEISSIKNIFLG